MSGHMHPSISTVRSSIQGLSDHRSRCGDAVDAASQIDTVWTLVSWQSSKDAHHAFIIGPSATVIGVRRTPFIGQKSAPILASILCDTHTAHGCMTPNWGFFQWYATTDSFHAMTFFVPSASFCDMPSWPSYDHAM